MADAWDASVRKHGGLAALGAKLRDGAERKAAAASSREARMEEARNFLPFTNAAIEASRDSPLFGPMPDPSAARVGLDDATTEALGWDLVEPHFLTAVCGPYYNAYTASSAAGRNPPIADIAVRARRWVGFPAALAAGLGLPGGDMSALAKSRYRLYNQLRKVRTRAAVWRVLSELPPRARVRRDSRRVRVRRARIAGSIVGF